MNYSKRVLEERLYQSFNSPFITGILGPRRVGKSTLIDHFIEQDPNIITVRLNMDKIAERDQVKANQLEDIILTTIKRPLTAQQRVWVTIDEAQKCPEVFEQIKILYDTYKDQEAIKFIITGSALLELHRLSAESLAGRIQLYTVSAFGLVESVQLMQNISIERSLFDCLSAPENKKLWLDYFEYLRPFAKDLQQILPELLLWGGLPEVLQNETTSQRIEYLASYLQTYLEKDIRAIESITDLDCFRQLMDIVGEQTGSVRDDTRIINALQCHRETLKKYRGYLQATLMYQDLYPYIGSSLKRLVKSPKGYLINNGLISYLQGIHEFDLLVKTGQIGHRLENWFLNELTIWLNKTPERYSIHYWRTSAGAEVDFVVKKPPYVIPFEVTFSSNIDKRKVHNLIQFLHDEKKAAFAYYIYMGEFKYDMENRIIFVPAWAIA